MVGRPFEKGVSGNPTGRPRTPDEIRTAATANKNEVHRLLFRFLQLSRDELADKLRDPKASMLELAVGNIVAKAAKDGDQIRLEWLLGRIIGKVADVSINAHLHSADIDEKLKMIPKEKLQALLPKPGEEK